MKFSQLSISSYDHAYACINGAIYKYDTSSRQWTKVSESKNCGVLPIKPKDDWLMGYTQDTIKPVVCILHEYNGYKVYAQKSIPGDTDDLATGGENENICVGRSYAYTTTGLIAYNVLYDNSVASFYDGKWEEIVGSSYKKRHIATSKGGNLVIATENEGIKFAWGYNGGFLSDLGHPSSGMVGEGCSNFQVDNRFVYWTTSDQKLLYLPLDSWQCFSPQQLADNVLNYILADSGIFIYVSTGTGRGGKYAGILYGAYGKKLEALEDDKLYELLGDDVVMAPTPDGIWVAKLDSNGGFKSCLSIRCSNPVSVSDIPVPPHY